MTLMVIVLAGGIGARFQENSKDVPKPLIQVKNRTQIFWATKGAFLSYQPDYFVFAVRSGLFQRISDEVKDYEFLTNYEVVDVGAATLGPAHTAQIALEKTKFTLDHTQLIVIDNDCFNLLASKIESVDFPFVTITESDNPQHCFVNLSKTFTVNSFYEKEMHGRSAVSGNYGFTDARQFRQTLLQLNTPHDSGRESYISDLMEILIESNYIKAIPLKVYFSLGTPHEISLLGNEITDYA